MKTKEKLLISIVVLIALHTSSVDCRGLPSVYNKLKSNFAGMLSGKEKVNRLANVNATTTTTKAPAATTTTTKAPAATTTTTKAPAATTTTTKAPAGTTTTTKAPAGTTTTTKAPAGTTTTTKAPTATTTTTKAIPTKTTTTEQVTTSVPVLIAKSTEDFTKAPRPPCTSTTCQRVPVKEVAKPTQLWAFGQFLSSGSSARSTSSLVKVTALPYGKTAENRPLQVFRVRPYYVGNVRNPKYVSNRPAIWIEAGFEGSLLMSAQVAYAVIDYLMNHCAVHCKYDYYVVAQANPDGNTYAATDSTWMKTRQDNDGSSCKGVDLLNNFAHGDFTQGSNDACSQNYRGSAPMSAPETAYQPNIKSMVKNIALSLTVTQIGSKISTSFAHNASAASPAAQNEMYMKAFINATSGYGSGVYSSLHQKSYGHPLDYNTHKYEHCNSPCRKNSFNVAIPKGTVPGNEYQYENSQVTPIVVDFIKGLMGLISHAKSDLSFAI